MGLLGPRGQVGAKELERWIEDADDLFRTFHQKEPRKDFLIPITWPKEWSVFDYASRTGYLSNKWHNDRRWVAYTHDHTESGAPEPVILIPRTPDHRGVLDKWGKAIAPMPALTWLAYCLDIELARPKGRAEHLDFKEMHNLPHLCGVKGKRYLFVVPQEAHHKGMMFALWSPKLEITAHGIVN